MLADKVRETTFNDAKGTSKDSALLGPPSVEFAPYSRVPNGRPRKDARQSTIDQDQEFIDFLQSLTNPISKPAPVDQENDAAGKGKDKVAVTPLVQFLKDRKANKGKESTAPSRSTKHTRQDPKDGKIIAAADSKSTSGSATILSPKKRSAQALKVEQAARDAVKVLNKRAANPPKGKALPSQPAAAPASTAPVVTPNSTVNAALGEKKRERGNASAAAKMLQRDLGLAGNTGGRGGRRGAPGSAARSAANSVAATAKPAPPLSQPVAGTNDTNTSAPTGAPTAPAGTNTNAVKPPTVPPAGPAATRARPKAPASANANATPSNTTATPSKPTPPPSSATQAFLKHANPSQGITEPLLEEAFAGFGTVNKVEIDKKKGFAYVDFAETESLQEAIKASPIKVAQGQVVVLERKTGPTLQARNARGPGPGMGTRGGAMPVGGRGGTMRGRGGFGRGGAHMHPSNNARVTPAAANAASNTGPTTSATPATPPSSVESSTPQAAESFTSSLVVDADQNT